MANGYIQKQDAGAKRYIPLVRVSFHTNTKCYQLKGELNDGTLDPTNQVLSVTTSKQMDTPAGAFTVTLAGDEWNAKLLPNDLVVIQMGYKTAEGNKLNTVMVGLIDRIRRQRSAGSNTVNTIITGRDFGKVLVKSALKFYPELGAANPDAQKASEKFFLTDEGWVTLMSFFTSDQITQGTPAVVLDNIIRYVLPKLNEVEWTVWDESKKEPVSKKVDVTNILRYNFAKVDMFLPLILSADQFEGAIWNLMERASIAPFTELFVDVREASEAWNAEGKARVVNETIEEASDESKAKFPKGKGYYPMPRFSFGEDGSAVMIALRNTPFYKGAWEQLYTHDLPSEDVLEEDLSYSDDEHYNLFWAGTTINPLGIDLKRVAPPLMNENAVKRYGISPLEVQIEGLAMDASDPEHPTLLEDLSKKYTQKLKDWFENNHLYYNGSMTVRGKGNYKIGQRLLRKGINREFYIEGVTQSFNVFDRWETTLQLTRGVALGGAPQESTAGSTQVITAPTKPVGQKTDEEVKSSFYTVKKGDSLWSIAANKQVYGKADLWTKLWDANKDALVARDSRNTSEHGKYIYPGQVLRIPK
jgi:hypothetical protein